MIMCVTDVTKQDLIDGVTYTIADKVSVIVLHSTGKCKNVMKFTSCTTG